MSRTILLADDSVTIQKVVELTFLEEDFDVLAVSTGDDALARLDEVDPVLVIADVHMPGADGYEVCRRVKEGRPELPVLLLVGAFESFDAQSVESCGAQGYLKKPFDSQELLRIALELVAGGGGPAAVGDWEEQGEAEAGERPVPDAGEPMEEEPYPWLAEAEPEPGAAAAEQATEPAAPEEEDEAPAVAGPALGDEDVERIARRVVELLSDKTVRDVAWEVVPELAEVVIRDRLRELESQVD